MSRYTLPELLGHGPQGRRLQRRRERQQRRAERADAAQPTAPQMPQMPPMEMLSISDRERCARALGVDMPQVIGMHAAPEGGAAVSAKLADAYIQGVQRFHDYERAQHNAEVERYMGRIDCATASRDTVEKHLASLGIDDPMIIAGLRESGAPLARPIAERQDEQHAVQREVDLMVARRVKRAMANGEHFDAKKLTAGQVAALLEIGVR
jgi:hypothetical protein